MVDEVLAGLDAELEAMYATSGRRSVPPEQLLKADGDVLDASRTAFCERLNYDMLFKWFLELPIDGRALGAATFTKNRQRLLEHEIAENVGGLDRPRSLLEPVDPVAYATAVWEPL